MRGEESQQHVRAILNATIMHLLASVRLVLLQAGIIEANQALMSYRQQQPDLDSALQMPDVGTQIGEIYAQLDALVEDVLCGRLVNNAKLPMLIQLIIAAYSHPPSRLVSSASRYQKPGTSTTFPMVVLVVCSSSAVHQPIRQAMQNG